MKKSLMYFLPRVACKATSLSKGFYLICLTLLLVQAGMAQVTPGQAVALNAVNQYCTMVQSTPVTGDFTVEAWVRPDATTDRSMSIFSSRYNADYSFDMKIDFVANGNSTIHADIGNGSAWLNTSASVAYKMEARHWYHIAYTVSGSANQYIIYVNGRQAGSGNIFGGVSVPVLFNSTHTNANIGKNESTGLEFFLGLIDEVRIYSKVLSASEILGEATGASTSSTGRVKYFSFENASGNTFTNVWNSSDPLVYQGSAISIQASYALVHPEATTATVVTTNSFIANWSAPVSGTITNYIVDVATDQNFTNKVVNGQSVNVGTTSLAVNSLSAGTQYYYRVRANDTAITTDSYGAYSNTVMVPPIVNDNMLVCNGSTTQLTAIGATGANYAWYTAATGGTLLASSAVFTTPAITANIHFYVQQTVNGVTSSRNDVLVQVLSVPSVPTITGPTNICQGDAVTLTTADNYENWISIPSSMAARTYAVAFVVGAKAYIGTGRSTSYTEMSDFWEFEPNGNVWTQKADYGGSAVYTAVGFGIGTKGYIGTGTKGDSYQSQFWEYDPGTNTWLQKADVPGGGRGAAIGFAIGSKGYIGQGSANTGAKQDFYEYNPSTDSWRQMANAIPQYGHTSFTIGTKGYIYGGYNDTYSQKIYEYDPAADTWTNKLSLPVILRHSMSFSIDNNAYIVGGREGISNKKTLYEYNPTANTIKSRHDIPVYKNDGVCFSIGTKGYIGLGQEQGINADFYEYKPGYTYSWSPGGANTASNIVTTSGNYNVTATSNNNGCSATSANTTVSVVANPATPVITVSNGTTTICAGSSVTLTAPDGFTYLWSPGNQTTQSISVATAGSYSVKVTNETGCGTTSAATVVTINALPAVPTITATGSTTFCVESSVKLSGPADASSHQWKLNGNPISDGATTKDITITAAGSYTVVVTNANGCTNTSAAMVVTENALPAKPVISVDRGTTICSGTSITLTAGGTICASANENTTLHLQAPANAHFTGVVFASYGTATGSCGSYSTSSCHAANSVSVVSPYIIGNTSADIPVNNALFGGDPCNLTSKMLVVEAQYTYDNPPISFKWSTGETTAAITVSPAANTSYTVAASSNGCTNTSAATVVTVNAVTAIATSPTDQTVCAAGDASFTVAATGAGTLSYQWKRGSTNVGINSATLSLTNVTAADAGSYTCEVTGTCGSATTTAATLTVNGVTAITTSPTGQLVCAGGDASFTVAATGNGILSYQWKRGSTNVGINSATLSLTNITAASAGSYTCVVTGSCGNATTAEAILTVNAVTAITTSPTDQMVCVGGNASFTVAATGNGILSYQWKRGSTVVGNNSATLSLTGVTAADAGSYTCVVTGICGSNGTTSASLVINPLPGVIITTNNSNGFVSCDGGSITLMAKNGGTVCGTAAEGGSVHLQAPDNTHFTGVVFASYGNPSGSCGSFAKGKYHAAVSESEVATRLFGNTDVTINADNAIFGDPSAGVAKYLYIEALYEYDNAPAGINYQWSTAATTSAITVSPTAPTTYILTATSSDGCNATVSKAISIGQSSSSSTTNIAICSLQLPYLWNNLTFTTAGSQTVHLTNITGCDSTATLNLTLALSTETKLYVDSSVVASGNGLSWSSAYKTLSEALDIARSGLCFNTILVAKGTYYSTGDGFVMQNGLAIYGGFDPQHGITALGDARLLPTSGASGSILSGQGKRRVIYNYFGSANRLLATAILDGFTLTAGFGTRSGGIYNLFASPTISNCAITGNRGGVYSGVASPVFTNCSISNNVTSSAGGGVSNESGKSTFINCTISNNTGSAGGGVYSQNSISTDTLKFIDCVISNNIATNTAFNTSGGIHNEANIIIINCTIANNQAYSTVPNSGGGLIAGRRAAIIKNSIFWGNAGTAGANAIPEVSGTVTVTNSLVQQESGEYAGIGNINADPLFIDVAARNYRLQACSPAINKGENNSIPTGITTDLAAATRIKGSAVDMGAYEFAGLNNGNPNGGDLLASNGDAASATISGSTMLTATASSCRVVANILPISPAPVCGNVTAQVWVDAIQPSNYVKRHYQITPVTSDGITPAANAGTATGRVTLYFTQQEFDDFNDANSNQLPNNPTDIEGNIPNLRIEKRSGTSSDGTGLPNTYPAGTPETFAPSAANGSVVWNDTAARWEVSFEVTGFSGFFVKTQSTPLPLRLISFSGTQETTTNKLQWQTADEVNTQSFELESSKDSRSFQIVATIEAVSSGNNSYDYTDATVYRGSIYYRLKMIDIDGTFTYSRILQLSRDRNETINLYPNPVADRLNISIDNNLLNGEAKLYNVTGRLVQTIKITSGEQLINVKTLPVGLYIIKFKDGSVGRFLKE